MDDSPRSTPDGVLARLALKKQPSRERRRHQRQPVTTGVLVWSRGRGHAATLVELGSGGALLQGGAWEPCPTDPATLALPLGGRPRMVKARVLRVSPGQPGAARSSVVALKFIYP